MDKSMRLGISFGITSGAITTLGLMVGLNAGTHSMLVVLGGIVTIAIADAFSDALGVHISEESESVHSAHEIWESTIATFFSKLIFAMTFAIPVIFLPLQQAVLVSVIWGLLIIALLSYSVALSEKKQPWKVVLEHLSIAVIVVIVTNYVGAFVAQTFV